MHYRNCIIIIIICSQSKRRLADDGSLRPVIAWCGPATADPLG